MFLCERLLSALHNHVITGLTELEVTAEFLGSITLASSYLWSNVFNLVTEQKYKHLHITHMHQEYFVYQCVQHAQKTTNCNETKYNRRVSLLPADK